MVCCGGFSVRGVWIWSVDCSLPLMLRDSSTFGILDVDVVLVPASGYLQSRALLLQRAHGCSPVHLTFAPAHSVHARAPFDFAMLGPS